MLGFGALALAGLLLLRPLAVVWATQPTYAYGWAIPILAAYLFQQRWQTRPASVSPQISGRWFWVAFFSWTAVLVLTVLVLEVVPDWRPALIVIAGLYSLALLGWCGLGGGITWLRHFTLAGGFLVLGAPWPYQMETALIQELSRLNAVLVADSLILFDFPVRAAGNTILTSAGALGIEQACSGIFSLQASVIMSLFLGEFYRLAWRSRAGLSVLGIFLALLGNYARLLFLAWSAERGGLPELESAHGPAGFQILVFTVAGLWLAAFFQRARAQRSAPSRKIESNLHESQQNRASLRCAVGVLVAVLVTQILAESWFSRREHPPVAVWRIHLPSSMPGFRFLSIPAATHELLGDVEARAGEWEDDEGWRWQVFWFRYPVQRANRLSAELHTPEVCLPAAGQREVARMTAFPWRRGAETLPVQPFLFTAGGTPHYVFWVVDHTDSSPATGDPRSLIYGRGVPAFLSRARLWVHDAWLGVRSQPSESLEVTVAGPSDYAVAQDHFEQFLAATVEWPSATPPRLPR